MATWLAVVVTVLLLVSGPLSRFVTTSSNWLDYPYPRAGSEGLLLYESLLVKHGDNLYAPITPDRFISGPYPPVYYWLAASLLPDSLPSWSQPGEVTSIFRTGRVVSLLSALVAAAMIPLLVLLEGGYLASGRRVTLVATAGGLIGGALLLTLPQVLVWSTRFRGDMLMIALTAAGLVCVAAGAPTGRKSGARGFLWLTAAAVLFSLAFFTKQTALAGPLASAVYLLLRDRKLGLKWCGVMSLAVGLPFIALDVATNHWFYLKMVNFHSLPLSRSTLTRLLEFAFWDSQWPLIIAALSYTALRLEQLRRARGSRRMRDVPLLVPVFVLASAGILPTGAVVGADHNHLLTSGLALSAATGSLLAWGLAILGGKKLPSGGAVMPRASAAYVAPIALLPVLLFLLFTSTPPPWYAPDLSIPSPEQQKQLRKIVLNVQRNPGALFFADDPGIIALAGKSTAYDDPFTMTALAGEGRWDESAFRDKLRGGKLNLLVLSCDVDRVPSLCRSDTFSPGVLDAIRAGYQVLFRDILFTYVAR